MANGQQGKEASPSPFPYEVLTTSELAQRLKVKESWIVDQSQPSRTVDPIPVFRLGKHRRYLWVSAELMRGSIVGAVRPRRARRIRQKDDRGQARAAVVTDRILKFLLLFCYFFRVYFVVFWLLWTSLTIVELHRSNSKSTAFTKG
jgi:hypothetical protein